MMGTEVVPEASVIFNQLTRPIAREDFINFSLRESFRSYEDYSGRCAPSWVFKHDISEVAFFPISSSSVIETVFS
jgi:hypothetical protein